MRKLFYCIAFLALPALCPAASEEFDTSKMIPGDVSNFELTGFDKKSGFKEWELFGKKAKYFNAQKIDVFDMTLDMFDGKKTAEKKATFTTDFAEVSAPAKTARGKTPLTVSGKGFTLMGDEWLWDGDNKFVEMFKSVKINFQSEKDEIIDKLDISSSAARMGYDGPDNIFKFMQNVRVSNDDFQITCDELETESPKKSAGEKIESLKEVRALKNVAIAHERIYATAGEAVLLPSQKKFFLTGSPKITDKQSGASVQGYKIEFTKEDSTATALSSPDKKVRARANIISEEDGKKQITSIFANSIKMVNSGDQNVFYFTGKVHIDNPEFQAFADDIEAVADKSPHGKNFSIRKITGKGNVEFLREARRATSNRIEIYPQKGEVWLEQNARLSDRSKGITLRAHEIILTKEDGRAIAFGDRSKPDSFIYADISQKADLGLPKSAAKSVRIKSRALMASWEGKNVSLKFTRDVEVSGDDIRATCNSVEVLASEDAQKGKSDVKKIEARGDVSVWQDGSRALAQIAKIYPSVEISGKAGTTAHRFMEFLTDPEQPSFRPKMILPEISGIGLSQKTKDAKVQKTEIVSDKQSYLSGKENDTYLFENNVSITGTDFGASCQSIEVSIAKSKIGKLQIAQISLIKDLKITQGGRTATAGRADINPVLETVSLTENPVVQNEDGSRAMGTRMVYTRGKQNISIENPRIKLPPLGSVK